MRNCDECAFAELSDEKCHCAHGNKPVFVLPDWEQIHSGEWGWMLRCRDFRQMALKPKPVTTSAEREEIERRSAQMQWRAQAASLTAATSPSS